MRYLIDSNCFIEPNRTFCPTDVGVSFWNKMIKQFSGGMMKRGKKGRMKIPFGF